MEKINLNWQQVQSRAKIIAIDIKENFELNPKEYFTIYGIPRGGIFASQAVIIELQRLGICSILVEKSERARIFVDDIIDTGKTHKKWQQRPFFTLVDKTGKDKDYQGRWISFPWERMTNDDAPVENIRRLLEYIGEDPEREGLKETPERVIKSYEKLFGGYKQKPADVIKVFEEDCDEMVLIKNVEFSSNCEHHMLPFYGKAHIAYIPDKKVIGISKLVRILEIYSRRLQIQERISRQVTEALDDVLKPLGAACVLEAQHLCMICRGVEKQNSIMVTSSLTGVFRDKPEARAEFMSMIK